jgi:RNA polymerase sigma factor (TIGR02999 family)
MVGQPSAEITALLRAWRLGNPGALEQIAPVVYDQLRQIARRQLRQERPDHSLQATALVHEAYLKLVNVRRVDWQDREHFFAVSARLMRRVLIDAGRARRYKKRGGGVAASLLDDDQPLSVGRVAQELTALDDALETLARFDERKHKVVYMRFFAGLTVEETAATLGVSPDTVTRDWKFARAWLVKELRKG